jgi:hypothetical protein
MLAIKEEKMTHKKDKVVKFHFMVCWMFSGGLETFPVA